MWRRQGEGAEPCGCLERGPQQLGRCQPHSTRRHAEPGVPGFSEHSVVIQTRQGPPGSSSGSSRCPPRQLRGHTEADPELCTQGRVPAGHHEPSARTPKPLGRRALEGPQGLPALLRGGLDHCTVGGPGEEGGYPLLPLFHLTESWGVTVAMLPPPPGTHCGAEILQREADPPPAAAPQNHPGLPEHPQSEVLSCTPPQRSRGTTPLPTSVPTTAVTCPTPVQPQDPGGRQGEGCDWGPPHPSVP